MRETLCLIRFASAPWIVLISHIKTLICPCVCGVSL